MGTIVPVSMATSLYPVPKFPRGIAGIDNLMALQKECAIFLTLDRL